MVLALAFCALQYGRFQTSTSVTNSILQNEHSEEELNSNDWTEGSEIKAALEENYNNSQEQFLGVSASIENSFEKSIFEQNKFFDI